MKNISVDYMGLKLESPLIAGSCGLTVEPEKVIQMEERGIGAVVIKSLFEEQINNEINYISENSPDHTEMEDYLSTYVRQNSIETHIKAIRKIKESVSIPVIASINCYSMGEWEKYAKVMEEAGANALELNIYNLPLNTTASSEEIEKKYLDIIARIVKTVKIPIAVKIPSQFASIPAFVNSVAGQGAKSIVMFNRFYTPDIDLDRMEIVPAPTFSGDNDYLQTLRWTAIISSIVKNIDVSASSGVHLPTTVLKLILAGANTVQLCSTLYKEGLDSILRYNEYLSTFLEKGGYTSLDQVRGKMNYSNIKDPIAFERVQFMKTFGSQK